MAAREAHFVTGATGFVGGALVLELLDRTDAGIWCLTRRKARLAPDDRLRAALTHAARAYGRPDLIAEVVARGRAMPGDVTERLCGLDGARPQGTHPWHPAGRVQFRG